MSLLKRRSEILNDCVELAQHRVQVVVILKESWKSRISNLTFLSKLWPKHLTPIGFTFTGKRAVPVPWPQPWGKTWTYIYSEALSLVTSFWKRIPSANLNYSKKKRMCNASQSRRTLSCLSSAALLLNIPRLPRGAGQGAGSTHHRSWLRAIPHSLLLY